MAIDDEEHNTRFRFVKRSPRLVAEEYYDKLEELRTVAQPLGATITRLVDPGEGTPTRVVVDTSGECRTWVDGELTSTGHVQLLPGPHVVAVHVADVGRQLYATALPPSIPAAFTVGLLCDGVDGTAREARDLLRVAQDAHWRWTHVRPGVLWSREGFDDRRWLALALATGPLLERAEREYAFGLARERHQPIFMLPEREAWVRISFTLGSAS